MIPNPDRNDHERFRQLSDWRDGVLRDNGSLDSVNVHHLSERKASNLGNNNSSGFKTFVQVQDEGIGYRDDDKPDYFSATGTITFMQHEKRLWYPSCRTDTCKRKRVTFDEAHGNWTCEKCQKSFTEVEHRYVLSITLGDSTGSLWVTAFNDSAAVILNNVSANDMYAEYQAEEQRNNASRNSDTDMSGGNGPNRTQSEVIAKAVNNALFKTYNFRFRAKSRTTDDEEKVQCIVMDLKPLDFKKQCGFLLRNIESLQGQLKELAGNKE